MTHLIYSKWDRGTKKFEAYATFQVVGEDKENGMNAILDGVKFARDTKNVEFVRRFGLLDKLGIFANHPCNISELPTNTGKMRM